MKSQEKKPSKKLRVIYEPKGRAREYAALAANPYRGCGHMCSYCYVPRVTKQLRTEFNGGAVDRPQFLEKLRRDALDYRSSGMDGQVMLSFTTDPYHPGDTSLTAKTLETFVDHDIPFCTLTKGGRRSLRDVELFRPGVDAYAATLTSVDDATARWESRAAPAAERMQALKTFHDRGIFTWVSLEPTLSADSSMEVVRQTHEYVDLYKVGAANYLGDLIRIDWRAYVSEMLSLLNRLGASYYFKKDLQMYLPS